MPDEIVPVLHASDARKSADWYTRLGFDVRDEHQFAPGLPLYFFLERGDDHLHISEHSGDAKPGSTLLYFYVSDIDAVASEFGAEIVDQPWCREVKLTDPDGNRLRVGERVDKETS